MFIIKFYSSLSPWKRIYDRKLKFLAFYGNEKFNWLKYFVKCLDDSEC